MSMPVLASPDELQRHERACRERVLAYSPTRRARYEWRLEQEAVLARLHPRPGLRLLDAGCGIGRISLAALRRGCEVYALDFAHARLCYVREHAPGHPRLRTCQADLTRLPLADSQFDAILCTQVLEHLPTPATRGALLTSFARLLRPGGELLLTVYNFINSRPREGIHESGIFFHCYEAAELRAELAHFDLLELSGLVSLLPRTYRLFPLLGPLGRALDHRAQRSPLSPRRAQLLLAHARLRP